MKKTFTINNFDKHLIIEDNDKTYLIDTGSPCSIFEDDSLEFLGQTCHKNNLMALAARVMPTDIAGKPFSVRYGNLPFLLERTLMGLSSTKGVIGYDFFNSCKVLIDYRTKMMFLV